MTVYVVIFSNVPKVNVTTKILASKHTHFQLFYCFVYICEVCRCVEDEAKDAVEAAGEATLPCGAVGCRAGYRLAVKNNVCFCTESKTWGPVSPVQSARLDDVRYLVTSV